MIYSQRYYWLFRGTALALLFGGGGALVILQKSHFIGRTLAMCLICVLALIVSFLSLHARRYSGEIQRQLAEKRTYWGFQIGILTSFPLLVALMLPNTTWLDSLVQFVSRNHAMPRIYFWAGFMLPVLFQILAVLSLRLLAKLRSGEQA